MDPLAAVVDSLERLLQREVAAELREEQGLHAVLRSLFPAVATDARGDCSLEYVSYSVADPLGSPEDCIGRGATWAGALKLVVRLVVWETADGAQQIRDVKEQEVFCAALPLLTPRGTFVVDGVESVLVARRMNLWLPEDGLTEGVQVPLERVVGAGEWLAHALAEGFALAVADAQKVMAGAEVETLMPHDLLSPKMLQRPLQALFADARRCQPALTLNPIAQVEQVRGVGEPITVEPFRPRQRIPRPQGRTSTIEPSPDAVDASVLAPFVEEGARALACAALRTARTPSTPQAPHVLTGAEGAWARAAGLVITAGIEGEVRSVDGGAVVLPAADEASAKVQLARRHAPGARRIVDRLVIEDVAHVTAESVLFEADGAAEGGVALGREALVALDDHATGALVSASFAEAFTTVETFSFSCTRNDTKLGAEFGLPGPQRDRDGLVRLGTPVSAGDVLVGLARPMGDGQPPFELRLREAKARGEPLEALVASGTSELLAAARARYGERRQLEVVFNAETGTLELLQNLRIVERITDDAVNCRTVEQARARGLEVMAGDELLFQVFYRDEDASEAHAQDAQYGELCDLHTFRNSLSRALRNEPTQDISLVVPPGVDGVVVAVDVWTRRGAERGERKSTLYRERQQLREALEGLAEGRVPAEPARGDELNKGVIESYRVVVERVRALQVGDRLVDRRGFGATVTRIVSPDELPALDGGRADVVFPSTGVPEGTLTELRLASAARPRETRFIGTPSRVELERVLLEAGISPTARTGSLYLLQLAES
jgi:DNA-directed RNA polymerase beta subunit